MPKNAPASPVAKTRAENTIPSQRPAIGPQVAAPTTSGRRTRDMENGPKNQELFYPILERDGIKPDLNTANSKLRYENAQDVLKYLTDIGVFDKKDLTEQRIRDAIVEHQVCGIVTASRVILKAREIRDGTQEEIEAKQKQIEERELAIQQEKRTQMQKMQIQQVYENAVKNIELTQ